MKRLLLLLLAATPTFAASADLVHLGRLLFYDTRLSVNNTTSCATCHKQELAFTDGRAQAIGATHQLHPRSAMSLVNIASATRFNWSDPTVPSLERQALKPLLSAHPIEMGFPRTFLRFAARDSSYAPAFHRAFPKERDAFTLLNIARAIAAFERSIVSRNSPWDRFHFGQLNAISPAAKRGEVLFFLDGGPSCFRCHNGRDFSSPDFRNTGLYNLAGRLSYPAVNPGLFAFTGRRSDIGKFKSPTLRNIALTAPYMHDGSIPTLEEVLDHYAAGGRKIPHGASAGDGHDNPNKDPLVRGFIMTPQNKADLVEFLRSLTDTDVLRNPAYSDPWKAAERTVHAGQ